MPRSFSGFQSRPQPQLFVVPREPEKTVKEKELPAGDLFEDTNGMEVEELRAPPPLNALSDEEQVSRLFGKGSPAEGLGRCRPNSTPTLLGKR